MTISNMTEESRDHAVRTWLGDFEKLRADSAKSGVRDLFHPDGYWRDLLALTWEIRTSHGLSELQGSLATLNPEMRPRNLRLQGNATTGVLGDFGPTIE